MSKLTFIIKDYFLSIADIPGYVKFLNKFSDKRLSHPVIFVFKNIIKPENRILFYPERPVHSSVAFKLCALLGYQIISNSENTKAVPFKYKNSTFFDESELGNIPSGKKILNGKNTDISKNKVAEIFGEVFGYSLEVNPLEYNGKIVVKSNLNALHKGEVADGPLEEGELKEGMVYQKEIDNKTEDELVLDYRVPIHGNEIPLVYLKYRPVANRFSNENNFVRLKNTSDIFNDNELKKILYFAGEMGIDYGELDILRDKDNKIYIVDVNSAPWGPPNGLPLKDQKEALVILKKSFKELIDKSCS